MMVLLMELSWVGLMVFQLEYMKDVPKGPVLAGMMVQH
jgi:hypothetical protein